MSESTNQNHLDPTLTFAEFAAAFVRGRQALGESTGLEERLLHPSLNTLTPQDLALINQLGRDAGLKLHKFKRTMGLARVTRVLGMFQSILPQSLLDVGSGRGAFLWPLLDQFPELRVTAIDHDAMRARDLSAVSRGGIDRLTAYQMDLTDLHFDDNSFDVVTTLEVLEHIHNFRVAITEAVRVSVRFVIASVPSKSDDNPEHVHLLTKNDLQAAFEDAGCHRVRFESVLNHLIVVATKG